MANKIRRNLIIIGCILAACVAIVVLSIFSSMLIDWLKSGWTYILTIALTSIACAIIFGIADSKGVKKVGEDEKEGEKPLTPWSTK